MSSSRSNTKGLVTVPQRVSTIYPVPGPPSYDQHGSNPDAPPPSYENLYGRRRRWFADLCNRLVKMKTKAKTDEEFNKVLIGAMCNSKLVTGIFVFYLLISIGDIIAGGIFLNDCRENQYIPISLISHGACAALLIIKGIVECIFLNSKNEQSNRPKQPPGVIVFIQWLLLIAGFGHGEAGAIHTFALNLHKDEEKKEWNCHRTFYYYSLTVYSIFVTLIFSFVITFIVTVWGVWLYSNTLRQSESETN